MKKHKVLVIPAWYDHKNKHEGIFIHEFCEALQNNGQEVALLYVKIFSLRNFYEYFKQIELQFITGYKVIVVKKINFLSLRLFKNGIRTFKNLLLEKSLKELKNFNFDIIHFQSLCNNITPFLGYEIAKNRNLPYVITEHYTNYKEAKGVLFEPYIDETFVAKVVKESFGNLAVSKFAAKQFEDYFGSKFGNVPNIIARDFFETPFKNIDRGEVFKFIFIGGLISRKGIIELVEAFSLLTKSHPDKTMLTIVGEGDLETEVKQLVDKNNLQNNVSLQGRKSKEEIIKYLDEHHCLVSMSEMETFGLAIAESLLRGRPVLAVDSGAVSELVDSKNGKLIPAQSKIPALASHLKEMVDTYSQYDKLAIRNDIYRKLNEEKIIKQYTDIYELALS